MKAKENHTITQESLGEKEGYAKRREQEEEKMVKQFALIQNLSNHDNTEVRAWKWNDS